MWSGRVRRERALARGTVDFVRRSGAGRGSRIVRRCERRVSRSTL